MKDSLSLSSEMMSNLGECEVGDEKTLSVPVRMTGPTEFEVTGPPSVDTSGDTEGPEDAMPEEVPEEAGTAPGVSRMIATRRTY